MCTVTDRLDAARHFIGVPTAESTEKETKSLYSTQQASKASNFDRALNPLSHR